jgi:hypothetical protein
MTATQTRHARKFCRRNNVGYATVNPLAYAFVGSSPTSPTSHFLIMLAVLLTNWARF